MRPKKAAILTMTVLSLTTAGCSKESRLVGEWQSNTPKSVHLVVEKKGASNDGFYDGFVYTQDGRTYSAYWRIKDGTRGPVLYLSSGGFAAGSISGFMQMNARPHAIRELTSEKFVVVWDTRRTAIENGTSVYEFQRVR